MHMDASLSQPEENRRRGKPLRRWFWIVGGGLVLFVAGLVANYQYLAHSSAPLMFDKPADIPKARVGLVLGTSRYINPRTKLQNLYFNYRMDAAAKLFHAKRVEVLLVSGNSYGPGQTEIEDMRAALQRRGVPAHRILEDPKGLRTLDSLLRCKRVLGERRFVVISQPFHNERAIFLSQHHGLDVVGFNAKPVRHRTLDVLREQIREHLARVKAMLDIFVLDTKARFPGKPRTIRWPSSRKE